jgi:AraC-like DNA-binding protein
MTRAPSSELHGLVRPWERGRAFELERVAPAPALIGVVERHWIARWDLRGNEPFRQETLPHPSINLVVEPDETWIWGVPTARATRMLQATGWAVGTKFQPGAFTAITGIDAATLTNGRMALDEAFGDDHEALRHLSGDGDSKAIVAAIEAILRSREVPYHPSLELVQQVIAGMRRAPPTASVEELAAEHNVAARTLQRLFRRYIGVGPKWVLKRLRVHQAAEQLASPASPNWTELALDLGYYDHAHFIRDFRLVVGRSPAQYAAEAAAGYAN